MWLFLLACAADPMTDAGNAYMAQMHPLFEQNRAIGEQFLQVASKVKKNEADPAAVASVLSGTVVSSAGTMATQAAAVHPADAQLASAHAELVGAWKHRAEAWSAVAQSWNAKDTASFDTAVADAGKASEEESLAASHLEAVLQPAGVVVDLYP